MPDNQENCCHSSNMVRFLPEVTDTVEKAVTAIKTQPRSLVDKFKKPPKQE
jgi:hypothetical protein